MPRLCLSKPTVSPPDGFRYVFPQDGYVAHAWIYQDWIMEAVKHCQANNITPTDTLPADMEEQLCLSLPPGWCNYDDPQRPRINPSMTWDDVKGGLSTFAAWIAQGLQYVSQTEAERRALICSRCYYNISVQGCAACHAAADAVVRAKKTKHDSYLRACGVCKCLLRAKVWFQQETLDPGAEKLQDLYPDFCWLRKDGPNYLHVPD
jgi:hypothetical protein